MHLLEQKYSSLGLVFRAKLILCPSSYAFVKMSTFYFTSVMVQQICERCGTAFATKTTLRRHTESVHDKTGRYICCGKMLRDREELRRHRGTKHGENKSHQCVSCPQSFTTKWLLRRHERSHRQEGFVSCDVCGLKVRNMASHSTQKNFACDKCERSYKYRSNLSRHKKKAH